MSVDITDETLDLLEGLGLSGRIPLRIDPVLHWEIATKAQVEGVSLNAWIADQLKTEGE